jgi:hypothetical protein
MIGLARKRGQKQNENASKLKQGRRMRRSRKQGCA